jgi:hypothetical protein
VFWCSEKLEICALNNTLFFTKKFLGVQKPVKSDPELPLMPLIVACCALRRRRAASGAVVRQGQKSAL